MMNAEIWKDITGYEGRYQVSNHGRVRSLDRTTNFKDGRRRVFKGQILSTAPSVLGYPQVSLLAAGSRDQSYAHHLVCRAFHGEPPSPAHQVAHNNGKKTDNHHENLRWATPTENSSDKLLHGTDNRGEKSASSKLTATCVHIILAMLSTGEYKQVEVANMFGVTKSLIGMIGSGQRWKHIPRPFNWNKVKKELDR
ncbi:NUMOD4 motif-containing HNH endonuclease [bacterium]|nr:NUMOD4 motif-containing HNH endonuclease [bacterium]